MTPILRLPCARPELATEFATFLNANTHRSGFTAAGVDDRHVLIPTWDGCVDCLWELAALAEQKGFAEEFEAYQFAALAEKTVWS